MEEWDFVEERGLQGWKGARICMTCQHLAYGVDQHCHTLAGCNLMQKQLQQGEHLTKRCLQWAPTWQKDLADAAAAVEQKTALTPASLDQRLSAQDRLIRKLDREVKALRKQLQDSSKK